MKRFAVRSLAFALALAAGTVAAQDYYDDRGPVYDDGYAAQYDDYAPYAGLRRLPDDDYVSPTTGYYGQRPWYSDPRVSVQGGYGGYSAGQGPAFDMARVVSVDPIVQPGQPVARQQCWNEPAPK